MIMLKFKSKINYEKVAEILEVEAGDTMEWSVDVENNEIKIIVSKE